MPIALRLRNPELKGKKIHWGTKGNFLNYYLLYAFKNLENELDLSSHTRKPFFFPFWIWLFLGNPEDCLSGFPCVGCGLSQGLEFCETAVALGTFLSGFQNSVLRTSFVASSVVAENSFVGHYTHPGVQVCRGSFLHKCYIVWCVSQESPQEESDFLQELTDIQGEKKGLQER